MQEPVKARRIRKTEFAGTGCALQGLGLLSPLVLGALLGPVGVIIGLMMLVGLFFVGSAKSQKWVCGNCRNRLVDKRVTMCPTCRAILE